MPGSAFEYLVFPHTLIPDAYLRHLSILLPSITTLQVTRPAPIPGWAGEFIGNWPAIEEQDLRSKIKTYLKGFQELATQKGMDGVLASFAGEWGRSDPRESRFQIESRLRGVSPELADPREWLRLEAAIFIELARDYDERQIDLASSLSDVDKLDDEFRQILGISDEEDLEEIPDVLSYSLPPDQGYLSFMLARRTAFWYRLLATRFPKQPPVLVTIAPALVDEIFEGVHAERGIVGGDVAFSKIPVARIPPLDHLDLDAFIRLRKELHAREELIASYIQEVEAAIQRSEASSDGSGPGAIAELLRTSVEQLSRGVRASRGREIHLSLIRFANLTHDQIWKRFDKAGYEMWGGALTSLPSASILLCLE